ncbi:MAG: tRNA (N6-threonylcarbamoyladenosine(37)-N6)-methyltransferase TrmO [Proteobacteria bacterium]|nr:tRNA (N6-threonylcarbamoyladenosine(37)-N6)-methyltransferase TrmO [Pseudomonadota bacterium]
MPEPSGEPLIVRPIGYVRSALATKVEAARQASAATNAPARIELLPGQNFEHALEDLESWKYIWVLFWFHHNAGWRPKILPPRSTTGRKGVFATRAPHRPNPIGMSVVALERVEGLTVHVRETDMLDGTPVLDIKPYVPYSDALPNAGSGWLGDQPADPGNRFLVTFAPLAEEQAAWVKAHTQLDLRERIEATLALGATPHPYRRIRPMGGWMQLAVKEWRVRFTVDGSKVSVHSVASGYRDSQLAAATGETLAAHRAYLARWPREGS